MSELIDRLRHYGADMDATMERFIGDEALYDRCFHIFLEDPSFLTLEKALEQRDYTAAFQAAHTLKGVSGNLGLTPLYTSVCEITAALRHGDYSNLEAQYAAIVSAKEEVEKLR